MRASRPFQAIFSLLALVILAGQSAPPLGAQGTAVAPDREQQWLVPTPAGDRPAHAVLFRPPGDGPFRLAVIAHATTENVLRRAQIPQPEYRALAAFLVARGPCWCPSGWGTEQPGETISRIRAAARRRTMSVRPARPPARSCRRCGSCALSFIRKDGAVVLGHSAGGWGALALASEDARNISAIIALAPGRGGHADDADNRVCAPDRLVAAAATLGKGARVPVTWLVAANDTYFSPAFSRKLADAFRGGGGRLQFRVLPSSGNEGHWMAETEGGVNNATADLDRALRRSAEPASGKR
jgi:dienelactone hydrolase